MSWPAGVISVLEMENNVTDAIGTYTWTNYNGVTFSSSIYKYGSYSADFDAPSSKNIKSDATIADIQTIEFWIYRGQTSPSNNYVWKIGGDAMQSDGGFGLRIFTGSAWTAFVSVPYEAWAHISCVYSDDETNVKIYKDGVETVSASSPSLVTGYAHWGNFNTEGFDGYLDRCILHNVATDGSETSPIATAFKAGFLKNAFSRGRIGKGVFK